MISKKEKIDFSKCSLVCAADFQNLWEYIRQLRTSPDLISGFIYQGAISSEQQIEYMMKYGSCYFVCFYEGTPVGFIGIIDNDIRIAVDKKYQRKGFASYMVNQIMQTSPNALAKIKADNPQSFSFFQSLGFKVKYYLVGK